MGVLEGLWLRAPHTGTIKGTQSDSPAEGSTRSGGGWEKPPWEPPQTEMLSQTLPSFIDFSFLNSTSCSDKKPGGGNQDYRESVSRRPSKWNQEGDDSEQDVSMRCEVGGVCVFSAWHSWACPQSEA